MTHDLKHTYLTLLLPVVAGFILIFVFRSFHLVDVAIPPVPESLSFAVFIASVCTAIALPIFYRALFASKMRYQTHTSHADWFRFERSLLWIAMVPPYVSLLAQILQLQRFHLAVKEVDTDFWIEKYLKETQDQIKRAYS